jgi:hypothetical protein
MYSKKHISRIYISLIRTTFGFRVVSGTLVPLRETSTSRRYFWLIDESYKLLPQTIESVLIHRCHGESGVGVLCVFSIDSYLYTSVHIQASNTTIKSKTVNPLFTHSLHNHTN